MTITKQVVVADGSIASVDFADEATYQEYLRLTNERSHHDFFEKSGKQFIARQTDEGTVRDDRQTARRQGVMQEAVQQALTRVEPGTGANVEYISFEVWRGLERDYKQAVDEGHSHNVAHTEVGYQPLPLYIKKLCPEGKKPIRPILQHEVGVRPNGVILVLKDQFPGDVGGVVVGPHTGKG